MPNRYAKKQKVEIRVNDNHLTDMSEDRFMNQMRNQYGLEKTLEEFIVMFNDSPESKKLGSVARIL